MSTPEKPFPDLSDFDSEWTRIDQRDLEFIRHKYINQARVTDADPEWLRLHRTAEKNRTKEDGALNPNYYRMRMEADLARLQYEMGFMVRANAMAFQQLAIMEQLYQRVGLLEGAYSYLQSAHFDVKSKYKDTMKQSYEAQKEFRTRTAMQRAGLDPDKQEDRLRWASKLDELTAHFFNNNPETKEQNNG